MEASRKEPGAPPPGLGGTGSKAGGGGAGPAFAITEITKQFRAGRRSYEIPEWGMVGDRAWYFRPITGADLEWSSEQNPSSAIDKNVRLLIRLAEYANGDKVFREGDRISLMGETEAPILQGAINRMYGAALSVEAATDLSEATRRSDTESDSDEKSDGSSTKPSTSPNES